MGKEPRKISHLDFLSLGGHSEAVPSLVELHANLLETRQDVVGVEVEGLEYLHDDQLEEVEHHKSCDEYVHHEVDPRDEVVALRQIGRASCRERVSSPV